MISPLNFAAQAVRDLRKMGNNPRLPDREDVLNLAGLIELTTHFQLPDGGRILDDGLKGLWNETLRLPYESITVEYRVPVEMHRLSEETPKVCTKRMAVAVQVDGERMSTILQGIKEPERSNFADGGVQIVVVDFIDGGWIPLQVGWLMPCKWFDGESDGEAKITGYPYTYLPGLFQRTLRSAKEDGVSEEKLRGAMVRDLWDEVCAVLALLEALSCSNVRAESIQRSDPKVNARRARDGKLPIYEVKVLTVDAPGSSGERRSLGGHHASPRQHLRRGHIRVRNEKKYWVNSHLVGDPNRGKVVKSYDVRRSP